MSYMRCIIFLLLFIPFRVFAQDERLADAYMSQGEYSQAAAIYEQLYSKNQYSERYHRKLLDVYRSWGKDDMVESLMQKQAKRFPEMVWYKIEYGALLEKKGESRQAKKLYDDALKNMPFFPDQVKRTASAFQQMGKTDYALQVYEKGEKQGGSHFYAFEKADLYYTLKQYALVSETLLQALKSDMQLLSPLKSTLSTYLEDDPDGPFQVEWKKAVLKEAQNNPSESMYNELLYWQYMQQMQFNQAFIQAKAIDKRQKGGGREVFELGAISRENGDYDMAVYCFEYIVDKGVSSIYYQTSKTELVRTMRIKLDKGYAEDKEALSKLHVLYQQTLDEMGLGDHTALLMVDYADLMAFYEEDPESGIRLLNQILASANVSRIKKAEAKLKLADIMLFTGDMWEPTLLYGQVEKEFKNDLPGQEAKFRSARLAYFREEFEFAHEQMKVLKASTSKLFSNDAMWLSHLITDNLGRDSIRAPLQFFSKADLAFYQNQHNRAIQLLDSLIYFYPDHHIGDEVLFRKAQIYSKIGLYKEAADALEKVWTAFPTEVLVDDALYMAADIFQFQLNNTERAMQLYEKIMLEHKDSIFVAEARKRYRILRGDKLN